MHIFDDNSTFSLQFTSAPACISHLTTASLPSVAAHVRGVD